MSIFSSCPWWRLHFPKGFPVNSSNLCGFWCVCNQTAMGQHQSPNTSRETEAQILERWPATHRPCISDEAKASAPLHLPASIPALVPGKFLAKASYTLHPLGTARVDKQGFKAISQGCLYSPHISASQTSQGFSTTLGMTGMAPNPVQDPSVPRTEGKNGLKKRRNLPDRSPAVCKDISKNYPMELAHFWCFPASKGFTNCSKPAWALWSPSSSSTHCREEQSLGNPPFAPDSCNPPCRF